MFAELASPSTLISVELHKCRTYLHELLIGAWPANDFDFLRGKMSSITRMATSFSGVSRFDSTPVGRDN